MPDNGNLKVPTSDEARKNGKAGGIASGEARREKKLLRDCINEMLNKQNKDGIMDDDGNVLTNTAALSVKLVEAALKNDWKAWELMRDTAGQKPIEKVMIADVDAGVVEQIESMVLGK